MPLLINLRHLEEKDLRLKGKLPVSELHLDAADELVKARLPLHYDLTARQAGRAVVVRGELKIALDCECARCLKPFPFPIVLADWILHLPLDGPEKAAMKNDAVDLTPYLREDILLEFPQHPLCDADCAGLPNRLDATSEKTAAPSQTQSASAWAELNKLKF
ncbi:MAG: YceD family protein [Verrucomicrobiota bacterium]|jgi:uncharacterized protein